MQDQKRPEVPPSAPSFRGAIEEDGGDDAANIDGDDGTNEQRHHHHHRVVLFSDVSAANSGSPSQTSSEYGDAQRKALARGELRYYTVVINVFHYVNYGHSKCSLTIMSYKNTTDPSPRYKRPKSYDNQSYAFADAATQTRQAH